MSHKVIDLIVDRVDLVDEGANSSAFIMLYKRKETVMNIEEILAKMAPEDAAVIKAEMTKRAADLEVANSKNASLEQDLTKAKESVTVLEQDLAKAKSKPETEPSFEEVLKGLDPAVQAVFKSMSAQKEAAERVARELSEKTAQDEALAKAKELKSIPVEEAVLVEVLKSASTEIINVLKAANDAIENSSEFSEVGKSRGEGTPKSAAEAWDKIEKRALEVSTEKGISKEKAIGVVIKESPDLYKQYLDGGAN